MATVQNRPLPSPVSRGLGNRGPGDTVADAPRGRRPDRPAPAPPPLPPLLARAPPGRRRPWEGIGEEGPIGAVGETGVPEALGPGDDPGAGDGGGCRRPLGRWGGMPRRGPSFGGRCLCCSTGTNLGLFMC
ncbi:hypothetical protein Srubr_54430 [Streptomyces rubradiris]|uniref:Uncharacterized protein n=1 Tax=Streptomyces rubradiris TaxID=285531 RepID=A0ABQ3RIA5_STRRR|nr:hypothetical protein GCM10018792_56370 [Streptomyces rubradiris]GHI55597.1 hypothetical protein Srubr_54430 [Streptomyces rubradiris]